MKVIWKYEIPVDGGVHQRYIPAAAEIVGVDSQTGQADRVEFWALVDDEVEKETRSFTVIGTGHPVPKGFVRHLGHVIPAAAGGQLVWHVIEVLS